MLGNDTTQQERLLAALRTQSLARSHELRAQGITATTIARAEANGLITRVSRGLYQVADSEAESQQALAEIAKQVPQGVICMVSALAFYGLTDQMPRRIWIAIEKNGWTPSVSYPPIKVVRFSRQYFTQSVKHETISGVQVPIYSIAKTLADVFRNPRLVDRSVAIESLKSVLIQKKATPSEIYMAAEQGGALNTIKPYLEALTSNG